MAPPAHAAVPPHCMPQAVPPPANNWAFGYSHKAPECSDAVVAMAQRDRGVP